MKTDLAKFKKLKLDHEAEPYLTYVYSLYDKAARFFQDPMSAALSPEQMIVKMKRAAMNGAFHYPNDLVLYLIGIFDSRNGIFTECQSYEVGSLYIGDFLRKDHPYGNIQDQKEIS